LLLLPNEWVIFEVIHDYRLSLVNNDGGISNVLMVGGMHSPAILSSNGAEHLGLAQKPCGGGILGVHPEDRALLGSNTSAAVDSNTAGLGSLGCPGRPPAGSIAKRKIPGGSGDSVPRCAPAQPHDSHPRIINKPTHFGRCHEARKPIRVVQFAFDFSHALIETTFLGLKKGSSGKFVPGEGMCYSGRHL